MIKSHRLTATPLILALLTSAALNAGAATKNTKKTSTATDSKDSKQVKIEPEPPKSEWQLKLAAPMWIAGISGDVGAKGFDTHVNVGADQILKHLNSTLAFATELRKDRFGVYADFLYLNISDTTEPNGSGLIAGTSARIQQYIGDLDVNYRIIEGPRGWVDALVGFRVTSISQQVNIYPNGFATAQASSSLVNTVAANVNADVRSTVSAALDSKLAALQANPVNLPVAPLGGPVDRAVKDQVQQIIESRRIDLAKAVAASDQAAINSIKADLTNRITNALNKAIVTPHTTTNAWVDPYIGMRARLNLNKAFYLTAKADIGGFGVGSRLTWEAYGALGCQLTRSIYTELGYRYLYVDYNSDDFLYKVSTQGAQISVGMNF